MGQLYNEITPELGDWITQQHLFFVATAPIDTDHHVNCSPKGMDTFRIMGPCRVGFLDLTGSGAETIAHLRENGRITMMFCAMNGTPKIVRLYGKGQFLTPSSAGWAENLARFPDHSGVRSIIVVDLDRISESCGYGVPKYQYIEDRPTLENWAQKKGRDGLRDYQQEKNLRSIDGLPSLDIS